MVRTREIVEHLAENDVTPEEFEAVVQDSRSMLKPNSKKYSAMTADEFARFQLAVAEEEAAKEENIAEARKLLPPILEGCQQAASLIGQLREAREAAGVSLAEMESRTGICKSALSRLENSKAPNPTLAYLQRYAAAIGCRLVLSMQHIGETHCL